MARRGRECEDAWGGFDTQQTVYDAKAEKKYESLIWKYMIGIAVVMLAIVMYMHAKELNVIYNGTCIVANYTVDQWGNEIARYYDENNKLYVFNISGMSAVHEKDKICMYYLDDIYKARSRTKWQLWVAYYSFFGAMFGISLWRIIKVYKSTV